ncbi:MAG: putative DNA-binding domain-containing protein [Opitutaceae bacterium]|nr:putative DNA-binding domain-containing protein [Opitutaceae bacterium]
MPRPAAKIRIPARVGSTAELAEFQRAVWGLVSRPLTPGHRMQRRAADGRPTREVAGRIVKPSDRLTALERLEIYNRMYWFRVLDSLHEDCPGLRAVLGERRFLRLAEAYLVRYPSRSPTLRDLPSRLARFIREAPRWTRPHTALCHDLARFEWAQVEAYDGAARPRFAAADLRAADPGRLRLALQPYLQLLELRYPVDDYLIAIKQRTALLRGDASHAPAGLRPGRRSRVPRPRRQACQVAIHRLDGRIYFKRLEPAAGRILRAIRAGRPLARALAAGLPPGRRPPPGAADRVQAWFRTWMQLGWFCRPE